MPNKTITINEPGSNDVRLIQMRFNGMGELVNLSGVVQPRSNDARVDLAESHFSFDVSDFSSLPQNIQDAIVTLTNAAVARYNNQRGF